MFSLPFVFVNGLTWFAKNLSNSRQIHNRAAQARKRTRGPRENRLQTQSPSQTKQIESKHIRGPRGNRLQTQRPSQTKQIKKKRPQEDEVPPSRVSPEPSAKRVQTTAAPVSKPIYEPVRRTISEARVKFWRDNGTWPTEEQEETMDRFRDLVQPALAKTKSSASLRRKRLDASSNTESVPTRTPSGTLPRELKSSPYRHPRYEGQLSERGSFMSSYKEGISTESKELCQKLLKSPQSPPKDTLFEDNLFEDTLGLIRGRNETRVVRDIAQLIVPSAEILAIRGAKHLEILRETTNAGWNNAFSFYGSRPQPDYGLGFKREAFTREQLQKLQPFIGNGLDECSYFAATYDMYFPFLTSEAICGTSALDVADRQNAHSQTVSLRGLFELFKILGRQKELHAKINGFSISHSDVNVRIWGHVAVIDGKDPKYYREPIAQFSISKTAQADNRWIAWTVVMNIFDLWVPDHFKRICSAVDMLPAGLDFEVSEPSEYQSPDPELVSSRSGLSQQLDNSNFADEQVESSSQPSVQPITPDTTIKTGPTNSKKKKTK